MAKSLIKNISWLGFSSAVVKPIWFFFITYVCYETMGTTQYGVMTASLALMAILIGIASIGTSQYTIREVARDHGQAALFLSNLFPVRFLLGLICLAIGLMLSVLLTQQPVDTTQYTQDKAVYLWPYLFAGVYALALNLTEYCRSFYRAHETLKDEAISIILEKVLTVSIGSVVLLRWPSAAGALAGIAAGMTVALILNLAWVNLKFARLKIRLIDQDFIRSSIRQALPLGMVSIFVLIYFRTDSVMLQSFKGELVTGQYGIAFRILEALMLFPGIIVAVLLPRLSTLFIEVIGHSFNRLLRKSALVLACFGIFIAGIFTLSAPLIINIFEQGASAEPATKALQILVWTFPFASVNYLFSTALTASNDQKVLAWMLGIAVIFNITLNLLLIPTYSLYGASVATLFTQIAVLVAMVIRYLTLLRQTDIS